MTKNYSHINKKHFLVVLTDANVVLMTLQKQVRVIDYISHYIRWLLC